MKTTNKQIGFTLIELMIAITIIVFLFLILSDYLISMLNASRYSNAKQNNEKEIMLILNKINDSLKWAGYVPTESLADMQNGKPLLTDNSFDDIKEIFPSMNINGCTFKAGNAVFISDDKKTLCLRNYLPLPTNSSSYNDTNNGHVDWANKGNQASIRGIFSCSGASYFSSIYNSYDKFNSLVTKISSINNQLKCETTPVVDALNNQGPTKSYTANSDINIESLYFRFLNNALSIDLTVSSGNNILSSDCTYPDPANENKTLSTNNRKVCTAVSQTYGLIK